MYLGQDEINIKDISILYTLSLKLEAPIIEVCSIECDCNNYKLDELFNKLLDEILAMKDSRFKDGLITELILELNIGLKDSDNEAIVIKDFY